MKFFAELQQTIDEDRQRTQKEELERQELESEELEKEQEQIEIVKEKPKGKTKKDKKKETKSNEESTSNEISSTTNLPQESFTKQRSSAWKIFLYLFGLWFFFAVTVVFVIVKSPHLIQGIIERLPGSYQGIFSYHFEKIREEVLKYLK